MKFSNARSLPERFFGLHMVAGVAEYRPAGKEPYRVFVGNDAINEMNPTFTGCPVFVNHVPEVKLENIELIADGWVVKSFFNPADGNHWCEFLVVTDKGKEAVSKGWKLSNAYESNRLGAGGRCNGVDYAKEVFGGEFEHLAIVPDPRYEESVILTPEQFKTYNEEKQAELLRLANEKEAEEKKEGETMKLKFFKRERIENSLDESQMVELPKSKKEVSVLQLVNEADERELEAQKPEHMANGEHVVDCGEHGKMTVNELVEKHAALHNELAEAKKAKDEKPEPTDEEKAKNEADVKAKAEADKKADEEKMRNEAEAKKKEAHEKMMNALNFDDLASAPDKAALKIENTFEIGMDQVARGKARYGSGK